MPFLEVGDVRLHYQRMGKGDDTVVFLHGLIMDNLSSWWYTVATPMAAHAESIVYDLRGHGLSTRTESGYSVPQAVTDLIGLLDALGIDRPVHLVGNSYGGVVALACAIAHPERVASLVLVEAHMAVEGQVEEDSDKVAAGLDIVGWFLSEREVNEWLWDLGGRKLNRMAQRAKELIFECTLIGDLRDSPSFARDALSALGIPALALYGEESDILSRAALLAELMPTLEVRVEPGCTHSILMEAVPQVRQQIIEWVADHSIVARRA